MLKTWRCHSINRFYCLPQIKKKYRQIIKVRSADMARLDFQDMEKSYTFKVGQRTKRKMKVMMDSRRVKNKTTNPAKEEISME